MNAVLAALPQWLAAVGGIAGIGALGRVLIDWRTSKATSKRKEVDASKVVTDTAVGLLKPLKEQIEYLTKDLRGSRVEAIALRDDVRDLHEYIQQLIQVIEAAGLPLPPRPRPQLRSAVASDVDAPPPPDEAAAAAAPARRQRARSRRERVE